MRRGRRDFGLVEIQMGPMIDLTFLLLVFFMVSSRPTKLEADIKMTLPGSASQDEAVDLPDEQRISIEPNGQVALNELAMDEPNSAKLPTLVATLKSLKEAADLAKNRVLVTVDPHDSVPHQRVVDVLGACAEAQITGVSFSESDEEEGTP